jgi:hypothetical protein
MRRSIVLVVLLSAVACGTTAAELTGFGFQFSLSLESISEEGNVQWWVTAGAFANITLDEIRQVRVAVGSRVTDFNPFATARVAQTLAPEFALIGDLRFQSLPQQGMKATARAGVRYQTGTLPDAHIEITTLPVGWRLTSFNRELRWDIFISGNASVDATLGSPETGAFGGRLTLTLLPEPTIWETRAIPLGAGVLLAPELMIHLGVDV